MGDQDSINRSNQEASKRKKVSKGEFLGSAEFTFLYCEDVDD